MIVDAIKERLSLFRLYLGLALALIGTITVWIVQNYDGTNFLVMALLSMIVVMKMTFFVILERKIQKEINLLEKL